MSVAARATYMSAKLALVQSKIQPIYQTYQDVCQMGVEEINRISNEILEIEAQIQDAQAQAEEWATNQVQKLVARLTKRLERLVARFNKMVDSLTGVKQESLTVVSQIASNAIVGISGISLEVELSPPDPLTGQGGNIQINPQLDLLDESTLLVQQTLMDPTTKVTSAVAGNVAVSEVIIVA